MRQGKARRWGSHWADWASVAVFMCIVFTGLWAAGVWEPPTPENIRKLDAKIQAELERSRGDQ